MHWFVCSQVLEIWHRMQRQLISFSSRAHMIEISEVQFCAVKWPQKEVIRWLPSLTNIWEVQHGQPIGLLYLCFSLAQGYIPDLERNVWLGIQKCKCHYSQLHRSRFLPTHTHKIKKINMTQTQNSQTNSHLYIQHSINQSIKTERKRSPKTPKWRKIDHHQQHPFACWRWWSSAHCHETDKWREDNFFSNATQ